MSYKNIKELPKDVQAKLSEPQQTAFMEAFNASEAATESEKLRAGWEAGVRTNSRIVHHAFLFRPGNWSAAKGDGKITEQMVDDAVFAINRCEELGAPIASKYQHSEDEDSIPVGITKNAVIEDGHMAYGDVYILQDARADKDGAGSKILVTIDQMADALLTDGMQLSVEAFYDVKIPSYYGDRVISLEPSAMAILPAGVAPATTEKLAAERRGRGNPVAFLASKKETQEGGKQMDLEELTKIVEGLVTEVATLKESLVAEKEEPEKDKKDDPTIAELEKANKDLQAKLDTVETEKLTAEVETLTTEVMDKADVGQAETMKGELEKITDLSEKKVALSRWNTIIEKPEDKESKLRAGRRSAGSSEDKLYAERDRLVDKRMADFKEDKYTALRTVNETFDFGREE